MYHDAERFRRAPGCQGCIDRAVCGGIHPRISLLDCTEHLLRQARPLQVGLPPQPLLQGHMQAIGGLSLDNIRLTGPALPVAPLPPVVPLIYHRSRRAAPLEIPAAAIKLAQLFDRRTGTPRFATRDELCHRFALSPSTTLVVSGVDKDPVIERWWGIGLPQRLAVIETMKAIGVAIVTAPNFSLCVDWPRTGDMAAMKRIARVYAEFMNAGLPATPHAHGRTDTDFARWAALLQRLEAITWLSYEFTTGAAYGERRDRHLAWLKGLAASVTRPLHLIVYGARAVVPELTPAFATVTRIDTNSFIKAVHRQVPVRDEKGNLSWSHASHRPTGRPHRSVARHHRRDERDARAEEGGPRTLTPWTWRRRSPSPPSTTWRSRRPPRPAARSSSTPFILAPSPSSPILKAQGKLGASADDRIAQVSPLWSMLATQEANTIVEFPGHAGCLRLTSHPVAEDGVDQALHPDQTVRLRRRLRRPHREPALGGRRRTAEQHHRALRGEPYRACRVPGQGWML